MSQRIPPPVDLSPSIIASLERLPAQGSEFTDEFLNERVADLRSELEQHLETEEWLKRFPGRKTHTQSVRHRTPGG